MTAIQADPFYLFPKAYFEALLSWRDAELAICKAGDQVLGGAIFLRGGSLMEYHLSATNLHGKRLGANNLLLHSAAERGRSAGLTKLYLGGGTDASQENPLFFFKAGFSSQRAIFKFGGRIHNTEAYESLKQKFAAKYEANPRRILFYR
jgi:lipid II:glycine glycyltransferase (peptidoglycan interpeptide bridge formation enzyme)